MNVVISGATGGIGRALSRRFAEEGSNLVLLARDCEKLEKFSIEIKREYKVKVSFFECDAQQVSTVSACIEGIHKEFDSIDLLINAAGIFPTGAFLEINEKDYQTCIDVNLTLPLLLSKGCFNLLANGLNGKIINIGSSSSLNGFKNTAIYCASKHAILGLSRALNDEWKERGVSVHCVNPGTVDTEMASVLDQDRRTYISPRELAQLIFDLSRYDGMMMVTEVSAVRRIIR